ncbi:MAG: amidohydrolase family protein [Alistipes sp.]|nr:amidohydrolase family protein [Alistipes sp.]
MTTRKIASHYLFTGHRLIRNCVVEVAADGSIVSVEQCDRIDSMAGVEFYSGILCPGWVNAHCHLELSYMHGAIAEGTGFAGFAREIGRLRGGYSRQQRLDAAGAADARMWAEGVEAVGDISNDESTTAVKMASKIRYHTFFEAFGLNTAAERIDELAAMADASQPASLTPHSTYSLQDGVFQRLAADGCSPLSIHFMESPDEAALYFGRGSLAEWYSRMGWECDFLHYGSPAERIAECVPSNRSVLLVHDCCVGRLDAEILLSHFSAPLYWVLCPESNRYISHMRPPVEMLRQAGGTICIGTDSLASATTLSMVEQMKQLQEAVPLEELLRWATWNGACALEMQHEIGSIEAGKRPGVVVLESVDLNTMTLTPASSSRRLV